ncbi:MAG: hypothetical protein JO171_14230 [Paludibacterium sp.]|uniref:hypothetical protein n=1 Tax=Paludibacterium sp. TaxID=1917523 RepID=UPI0025E43162|nr:hypothetical protein [Paludibacterium sp.]MBV8048312.1 hypothetical protein [Paludibacterium sp.]MBV8648929.1 hypothetical protein [Paludibacterium sp.]
MSDLTSPPPPTITGEPVPGFPIKFTWQTVWQPVFDLQTELIRNRIQRARAEGKSVIYMSLPVSTEAGGFQVTNVEIAQFTHRRLSNDWGDGFFFLNPADFQLHSQTGYSQLAQHIDYLSRLGYENLPTQNSAGQFEPVPSGGSYMYMWTRVLVTNQARSEWYIDYEGQVGTRAQAANLGYDFDGVYFLGPTDVRAFFSREEASITAGIESYFASKLALDTRFQAFYNAGAGTSGATPAQVQEAQQNARREFIRYFALRASSNFAIGCHDEWNIFQTLNQLRYTATQNTGNQLAVFFDGRQVSPAATTIPIPPGFALNS